MSSFCEYAGTKPAKTPKWFAIDDTRPLVAFAGVWTEWNGIRGTKANPVEGRHLLYGFLTTEPNSVVAPIHPKAMPVILTTPEEWDVWMRAPWMRQVSYRGPCPTLCSGSLRAASVRIRRRLARCSPRNRCCHCEYMADDMYVL